MAAPLAPAGAARVAQVRGSLRRPGAVAEHAVHLSASVERVVALVLIGAAAAGLLDVAKKWPVSLSAIPTAFFAALLPAASHVDAASGRAQKLHNLASCICADRAIPTCVLRLL